MTSPKPATTANLLRGGTPHLNKLSRDMVLCREEAKRYAICVSSRGVAVEQFQCQKQFSALMTCLGKPL